MAKDKEKPLQTDGVLIFEGKQCSEWEQGLANAACLLKTGCTTKLFLHGANKIAFNITADKHTLRKKGDCSFELGNS